MAKPTVERIHDYRRKNRNPYARRQRRCSGCGLPDSRVPLIAAGLCSCCYHLGPDPDFTPRVRAPANNAGPTPVIIRRRTGAHPWTDASPPPRDAELELLERELEAEFAEEWADELADIADEHPVRRQKVR